MNVARIGGFSGDEFFAVVTEPVLVRFNASATLPWRCEIHGRHVRPTCEHERAAQSRARKKFPRPTNEGEQP
jgi:hypothetical protein